MVDNTKVGEIMGMYNEVIATCPKCRKQATIQISQIVLGSGNFSLDDMNTFSGLTDNEIAKVRECVLREDFYCSGTGLRDDYGCGNVFNPLKPIIDKEDRARQILFEEE